VVSGFCREVNENCARLGYYAARSDTSLPTFRDNPSVPCSRVKILTLTTYLFRVKILTIEDGTDRLFRNVGKKLTTARCVIPQKIAVLISLSCLPWFCSERKSWDDTSKYVVFASSQTGNSFSEMVTFLICILEVPSSNLGQDTDCPDRILWFPSFRRVVRLIMPVCSLLCSTIMLCRLTLINVIQLLNDLRTKCFVNVKFRVMSRVDGTSIKA
jgi:hypothetical protein